MTIAAKLASAIDRPMTTRARLKIVQATIGCTKKRLNTKSSVKSASVPTVYRTGPESALTSPRTPDGSEGTNRGEADSARLASTIMTPATTAHTTAQPGWLRRLQSTRAQIPFMAAMNA